MRPEAWPQAGQFAVVACAVATMVIRSGDGRTCSTARSGGIKGKMCFDKRIQQLQTSLQMGLQPRPCHSSTQSAGEPQVVRFLPRQLEPVQRAADGLAAEAAAELRLHKANQTPQRPAWLYFGPSDRRAGCLMLRGTDLLAKRGGNIRAKGGRPPVR